MLQGRQGSRAGQGGGLDGRRKGSVGARVTVSINHSCWRLILSPGIDIMVDRATCRGSNGQHQGAADDSSGSGRRRGGGEDSSAGTVIAGTSDGRNGIHGG